MRWEASLRTLADLVDTPIHFDAGEEAASADLETLRARLGGETEAVEQLNQVLAKQDRQRQRFAKVETLFGENQATVLRKGDSLIIRMIGLNFDVGQATLKPVHYPLLSSLKTAIAEFPESSVVIEGHTDAFRLGCTQSSAVPAARRRRATIPPCQHACFAREPDRPGLRRITSGG